ncbi:MAG: DNA polymerase II large subunit [Candidatus Verstraetearchaeota archaeon]|nr:DNA polymerase II large subunit [Candidatus Verstraetearchaeota archaeon]
MPSEGENREYFQALKKEVARLYWIAEEARKKGLDPSNKPEIYQAIDLAARVEGLMELPGVADRIRELSKTVPREIVAFKIAEEILYGKFGRFDDERAAELAVRTALAILTEGITAASLQGIDAVKFKKNPDGTTYLAVYFAGPIRSAGGTEQALTVLIADFVRRVLHLDVYKPTTREINRFIEELRLYERRVARFQYHVSDQDLRRALERLPVEVTGPPTDQVEVSVYRDLERIETNMVRGGALRVVNDGIVGKATKLKKFVDNLNLVGWEWLEELSSAKKVEANNNAGPATVAPKDDYLVDVVGGRPIFAHPSSVGGFRLRYGRARNTGLAALGVHPATMVILRGFIAVGTQLRIERPGKSATITPVDGIEGPIIRLTDGSVVRVESMEQAEKVATRVEKILYLGDIVVGFGEFLENNHPLMPAGYCEEWWAEELRNALLKTPFHQRAKLLTEIGLTLDHVMNWIHQPQRYRPSVEEAFKISEKLGIPLHPRYTYFWDLLSVEEVRFLREWLSRRRTSLSSDQHIEIEYSDRIKELLEKAGIPHKVAKDSGHIVLDGEEAHAVWHTLKIDSPQEGGFKETSDPVEYLSAVAGIPLRRKGGTFIGARMGRPEKAKPRLMKPPVHVLYPVGLAGGATRDVVKAAEKEIVGVEMVNWWCDNCKTFVTTRKCPFCGREVRVRYLCKRCGIHIDQEICPQCKRRAVGFGKKMLNLKEELTRALNRLGMHSIRAVKGVKGLASELKIPELLEKGILRAKYELYVYKDGTCRFDVTNAPLTHFKPREIGVSVEELRKLGYHEDVEGNPLENEDQIVELKVQDIIIPEKCASYLFRVSRYIDELLEKVYGLPPYYNLNGSRDLIGHLVIGIAPHTSAGVIGRIIGFTKASVCYAHPYWHAAKRRNCDGDEDAVMLALDALLNFSRSYLPAKRGGMMDAPLVLTITIDPLEVDDESHNIEVISRFPLEFYKLAEMKADPKEARKYVEVVKDRLGDEVLKYKNLVYVHDTEDISMGPKATAYSKLKTMLEKVQVQLNLAEKIKAVDAVDVAERLLKHHFIPDLAGNLRAYFTQSFRCKRCGTKYRRPPLSGRCLKCRGEISLTVFEGTVDKYLSTAYDIVKRYQLDKYLEQHVKMLDHEITDTFSQTKQKLGLEDFLQFSDHSSH